MYNSYTGIPSYSTMPSFPNQTINWVLGRAGAQAFPCAAGCSVLMMDSENEGTFYIKTTDNIGISSLRTFKYEEVLPEAAKPSGGDFVTHEELAKAIAELKGGLKNE